jgi:hypothetical protein
MKVWNDTLVWSEQDANGFLLGVFRTRTLGYRMRVSGPFGAFEKPSFITAEEAQDFARRIAAHMKDFDPTKGQTA